MSLAHARGAVERLALLAAAEALRASAPSVAEAFAQARLTGRSGRSYGSAELSQPAVTNLNARVLPAA